MTDPAPEEAKPWESYWRNRIGDEIAQERDKTKKVLSA